MAGAVGVHGNSFRADFQRREGGRKEHIYGPRRGEKRKAEQDLEALRAAAEQAGSDAAWSSMSAECHRLQERADFEARVSAYVATNASIGIPALHILSPTPEESELLDSEDSQPYDDSREREYYNDVNEFWQEADEVGRLPDSLPSPIIPVPDPKDSIEATALLSKFRPARGAVEDLKKLLDARADPNITLSRSVHPLMKVMTFADKDRVGPMRELLLQAGATESDEAKERWEIRRRADACEDAWLRNFHCDPRPGPC
jgi:hypothetical protein